MNDELENAWDNGSLISLMWPCCPLMCMMGLNETTENPHIGRIMAQIQAQSITATLTCPVVCSALGVRRHAVLVAIS